LTPRETEQRRQADPSRRSIAALLIALVVVLLMGSIPPAEVVAQGQREPDRARQKALVERFKRGLANPAPSERGGPNTQIVGGVRVEPGKYRFMTFVQIELPDGAGACGGSVIDASHVLTAAHCVTDDLGVAVGPEDVLVAVGINDLTQICAGCVREVTEIAVHPGWNPLTEQNDAAVLELASPVLSKRVRKLPLVGSGDTRFDVAGRAAIVAGWGTTSSGGDAPDRLREATVKVVNDEVCQQQYSGDLDLTVMICAAASGKDSCQGDSGGPLFVKQVSGKRDKKRITYTQIGIVSFGIGCADPDFAGVYTRLSAPVINDFVTQAVGS
jgi:secreted trypsin-like serine protease